MSPPSFAIAYLRTNFARAAPRIRRADLPRSRFVCKQSPFRNPCELSAHYVTAIDLSLRSGGRLFNAKATCGLAPGSTGGGGSSSASVSGELRIITGSKTQLDCAEICSSEVAKLLEAFLIKLQNQIYLNFFWVYVVICRGVKKIFRKINTHLYVVPPDHWRLLIVTRCVLFSPG